MMQKQLSEVGGGGLQVVSNFLHNCHAGKTNVITAEKISALTCGFWVHFFNHMGEDISCERVVDTAICRIRGEHRSKTEPDRPRPDQDRDRNGPKCQTEDRTEMVQSSPGQVSAIYTSPFGQAIYTSPFGQAIYTSPFGQAIYTYHFGQEIYTYHFGQEIYTHLFGQEIYTEHGRMILESVEHGPLIWLMIEENGVIRMKKYAELYVAEKIQADCDMKATNIILQDLPTDIYLLLNHHRFSPSQQGSTQPHQHYSSHYPSPTQFNHSSIPPSHSFQSHVNHQTSTVPQVIPQVAYQSPQALTQLMTESPFVDSGFVVPVFSPGDDPIACLNKALAFLAVVVSSRFLSTNNQIKTSSNTRNQATIQDGMVTLQQVQWRQGKNYSGTTYKGNATSSRGNTTSGQARVVKCYNCQDPRIPAGQAQTIIPHNAAFQTEDLDTYDYDCDDLSNAQAVLMANISNYGSDVISEKRTTPNALTEEVKTVFDQIEAVVQQSSVDKQCLEIANKELLLENNRLSQQIMSQDIVSTVIN
nr:hypothetical protein [Tanacetum cinerariifolium]